MYPPPAQQLTPDPSPRQPQPYSYVAPGHARPAPAFGSYGSVPSLQPQAGGAAHAQPQSTAPRQVQAPAPAAEGAPTGGAAGGLSESEINEARELNQRMLSPLRNLFSGRPLPPQFPAQAIRAASADVLREWVAREGAAPDVSWFHHEEDTRPAVVVPDTKKRECLSALLGRANFRDAQQTAALGDIIRLTHEKSKTPGCHSWALDRVETNPYRRSATGQLPFCTFALGRLLLLRREFCKKAGDFSAKHLDHKLCADDKLANLGGLHLVGAPAPTWASGSIPNASAALADLRLMFVLADGEAGAHAAKRGEDSSAENYKGNHSLRGVAWLERVLVVQRKDHLGTMLVCELILLPCLWLCLMVVFIWLPAAYREDLDADWAQGCAWRIAKLVGYGLAAPTLVVYLLSLLCPRCVGSRRPALKTAAAKLKEFELRGQGAFAAKQRCYEEYAQMERALVNRLYSWNPNSGEVLEPLELALLAVSKRRLEEGLVARCRDGPPSRTPIWLDLGSQTGAAEERRSSNGRAAGPSPLVEGGVAGASLDDLGGEDNMRTMLTCVICADAVRNTVINPCGHSCMCRECAVEFRDRNQGTPAFKCPICRAAVGSIGNVIIN